MSMPDDPTAYGESATNLPERAESHSSASNADQRLVVSLAAPLASLRLLSVRDVCDLFGRTDRTVRNWIRAGLLQPRRVGRSVFFLESDVMKLLDGDTPHASDEL